MEKSIEIKKTTLFGLLLFFVVLASSIFLLNEYDQAKKSDRLFEIIQKLKSTEAINQIELNSRKYQNEEINEATTLYRFRESMKLLSKEIKEPLNHSMNIYVKIGEQDFKIFTKYGKNIVKFLEFSKSTASIFNDLSASNVDIHKINIENNKQLSRYQKAIFYPIINDADFKCYIQLGYSESN